MMRDIISFAVPGSMAIHELQVGIALTRFLEADLEFFGMQCVESYEKNRKYGEEALAKTLALKEYLRNCHPYCAATLKTDLSLVAVDCIIDHICQTEDIGLEELWVRYLASEKPFEKAIFERITDYKTGYAINQWTNLVRMKSYATAKTAVIYGDDEADISIHRARALYYDMTFRLAASKLGYDSEQLPQIRYYSLPLMPEAMQLLRHAVNTLEDAMKPILSTLDRREPIKGRECVRDQMAGMAINAIRGIKPPDDFELRQFIQMYRALPESVFEPGGMKAVIDLEFNQLMEKGFYLKPSQNSYIRERYASRKVPAVEAPAPTNEPEPETALIQASAVIPTPEQAPAQIQASAQIQEQTQTQPQAPVPEPPPAPVKPAPSAPLKIPPLPPVPFSKKQTVPQPTAAQRPQSAPAAEGRRPRGRPKGTTKTVVARDVKAPPKMAKPAVTADAGAGGEPPVQSAAPENMRETTVALSKAELKTEQKIPAGTAVHQAKPDREAINDKGKVEAIIRLAEDPGRGGSRKRTLQEINNRCNLIWTSMNDRMGWSISPEEASLWFKYLTKLRYGIGKGELEPAALDRFLDATVEIFKIQPVNA